MTDTATQTDVLTEADRARLEGVGCDLSWGVREGKTIDSALLGILQDMIFEKGGLIQFNPDGAFGVEIYRGDLSYPQLFIYPNATFRERFDAYMEILEQ